MGQLRKAETRAGGSRRGSLWRWVACGWLLWAVGPSLSDPRTGEILRTVVRMDSWRSLIDYNIYAGLLPAAGPNGLNVTAELVAAKLIFKRERP